MGNKFLILFLLGFFLNSNSQIVNCDKFKISAPQQLYNYDCDSKKKLFYTLSLCQHFGKHSSIIEITKSDENDTTEIKGYLKIDIGYFEQNEKDKEEITSLNYQKDEVKYTTEKEKNKSTSLVWEKWYALMRFNCYVTSDPKITFDGSCKLIENDKIDWSNWTTLWENKTDSINVKYRTKSYFDKNTNQYKTDIEIQGPVNFIQGEVFIRGKISNGKPDDLNTPYFILNENGKSVIKTIQAKDFNSYKVMLTQKNYKKSKSPKIKTKTVVIGNRG